MEQSRSFRPRISRETRLLLTTALLSVAALWMLARVRFPDRPATPNPVPPLLTQLAPRPPAFDDLASEILQLQLRLGSSLLAIHVPDVDLADSEIREPEALHAVRIRDDVAVALMDPRTAERLGAEVRAADPASGLAIVRVASVQTAPPVAWSPQRLQRPRYLMATAVSPDGVSIRPTFVGSLHPIVVPIWPGPIWAVPARSDLVPGSFLFTLDAVLAGLVVESGGQTAIVPTEVLLAEAARLIGRSDRPPGQIGVEVQRLTPPVARATATNAGVVVTWVDPQGAAAGMLKVGDVIDSVGGQPLPTLQHWAARIDRLAAGDVIVLRARRGGVARDLQLVASAAVAPPGTRTLGLTMRRLQGIGAEVVSVDEGSVADRAGLKVGDALTLIANIDAPTPTQISRVFASASDGASVLVALSRDETHYVTALEK